MKLLNVVSSGTFYVAVTFGFGFASWGLVRLIFERAEIGWYLLWVIPMLLFTGSGFLALVVLVPLVVLRDWKEQLDWKKYVRSKSDKSNYPHQGISQCRRPSRKERHIDGGLRPARGELTASPTLARMALSTLVPQC